MKEYLHKRVIIENTCVPPVKRNEELIALLKVDVNLQVVTMGTYSIHIKSLIRYLLLKLRSFCFYTLSTIKNAL